MRPLTTRAIYLILATTGFVGIGGHDKNHGDLQTYAFSDTETKFNMADGYVFFEIVEPQDLAYTYKINPADFAEPWNATHYGVGLVPSDPACGCGSFANDDDVEGNIALIERGECSFVSKAIKAMEAGAIAAVITDNDAGNDELYVAMQDDSTEREVTIPVGFLLGRNGQVIRNTLHKLHLDEAVINIPINLTNVATHKWKQPPWVVW